MKYCATYSNQVFTTMQFLTQRIKNTSKSEKKLKKHAEDKVNQALTIFSCIFVEFSSPFVTLAELDGNFAIRGNLTKYSKSSKLAAIDLMYCLDESLNG